MYYFDTITLSKLNESRKSFAKSLVPALPVIRHGKTSERLVLDSCRTPFVKDQQPIVDAAATTHEAHDIAGVH